MLKKKKKEITLIALVVTIVVLLILAGISISMLTGENGVITQAKLAKENTRGGDVQETIDLTISDNKLKETGKKTKETLVNELYNYTTLGLSTRYLSVSQDYGNMINCVEFVRTSISYGEVRTAEVVCHIHIIS